MHWSRKKMTWAVLELTVAAILSACSASVPTPQRSTLQHPQDSLPQTPPEPADSKQARLAPGFSILEPIRDADPTVRHRITVRYPTKLSTTVSGDTLAVSMDVNSCESTNMMVGGKMIVAARDELFLHPEGEPRALAPARMGLHGGLEFGGATNFFDLKQSVELTGKRLVVEMDLTIFETDIPPQHEWSPHSAKYKELWKYTLTQVVK